METEKPSLSQILKKHSLPIIGLTILILIQYNWLLDMNTLSPLDYVTFYLPRAEIMRQSIEKFGDYFPLWNPFINSGTPLYGQPSFISFDSILGPLTLLTSKSTAVLKLATLFNLLFAALAMYILIIYLLKSRIAAFISGFIFVSNQFIRGFVGGGGLTTLNGLFIMPLALLFIIKAFKSKEWAKYSLITGLLLGIQFRVGPDMKTFAWTALMVGGYGLFYIIGKNIPNRIIKFLLVMLLTFAVCLGIGAQKILPVKDYIDVSSRNELGYEQSRSGVVAWGDLFSSAVEQLYQGMPKMLREGQGYYIGIIPFILACIGIYKNKNKKFTWFLVACALLSILVATGTFIFYLLWKFIPVFRSFRHLYRVLILYNFIFSILAGYGTYAIFQKLEEKKSSKNAIAGYFIALVALLFITMHIFGYSPSYNDVQDVNDIISRNEIMHYIAKQPGIFRVQTYETRGIDWGTEFTKIPLGIQHIYGYETAWYPPYLNGYLTVANQDPAKLWGILNAKYMHALENVSVPGFRYIGAFRRCENCFPQMNDIQKAFGNYLYENEKFLPRVYFVKNAILVPGKGDYPERLLYSLMLDSRFNPSNTVMISGKPKISNYNSEELKRFKVIVLTPESIDEKSGQMLKSYVDSGGIIIPDILNGKNSASDEEVTSLWNSLNGTFTPIPDADYITHNFDRYELKLNGKYSDGFLVLSEKFSVFPGWKAVAGKNNLELLAADGIITAVYLGSNYDSIVFDYLPESYVIGRNITLLTITGIALYFIFYNLRKIKKLKAEKKQHSSEPLQQTPEQK